jgi:hypothetical protein
MSVTLPGYCSLLLEHKLNGRRVTPGIPPSRRPLRLGKSNSALGGNSLCNWNASMTCLLQKAVDQLRS